MNWSSKVFEPVAAPRLVDESSIDWPRKVINSWSSKIPILEYLGAGVDDLFDMQTKEAAKGSANVEANIQYLQNWLIKPTMSILKDKSKLWTTVTENRLSFNSFQTKVLWIFSYNFDH